VTGAGGFIGSHLVEQLVKEGCAVRAFVHYNAANNWYNIEKLPAAVAAEVEVVAGDITDSFSVDRAVQGCEKVFHLAALIGIPYSYSAPAAYVATNVTGTLNVLQACLRHRVQRLVHTSTSEVYGTAQYVPIDEKHPLVGQSPYSASKIAADKLVESFWNSFDLPACIVRPFNTYGPRQSARAIIPTIIAQALNSDTLKLGNLDPVRDLTFAADTARGFIAASQSDSLLGEAVNLGVGEGFSVREIAERIIAFIGKKITIAEDADRIRPAKSEVMRLISNNAKMRALTGWAPAVAIDTGLQATIAYLREHLTEYKATIYNV
jgi:NAD dependent epimerase/dehydratase